jgi:hypothetical protein
VGGDVVAHLALPQMPDGRAAASKAARSGFDSRLGRHRQVRLRASLVNEWRLSTVRTVPLRERMTIDLVRAPDGV